MGRAGAALTGEGVSPPRQAANPPSSYVHLWVDVLESDVPGALRRTIHEALELPREHGEVVHHMTSTTTLEMVMEPGFDEPETIASELVRLYAQLQVAKSA